MNADDLDFSCVCRNGDFLLLPWEDGDHVASAMDGARFRGECRRRAQRRVACAVSLWMKYRRSKAELLAHEPQ